MNTKTYNELIEEAYNNLTNEELWDFILDAYNYLKSNQNTDYDKKQTEYYNKSVDIVKYCIKNKRISYQQFKALNAFCRLVPIANVVYRELN